MHKSQIFFLLMLAFIFGISIGSFFVFSKFVVGMLSITGIAIIAISSQKFINYGKKGIIIGVMLIITSLGIIRINSVDSSSNTLIQYTGQQLTLSGYITKEPEIRTKDQRFVFTTQQGDKVLIITSLFPRYNYADQLDLTGTLNVPYNVEGSDFNYVSYLAKDDIFTTMRWPEVSTAILKLNLYEKSKLTFFSGIFKAKRTFINSINQVVPEPNAAFLNGILVGVRSDIPQNLKNDFSTTGTTHVLAISGYNITLIGSIIAWFFVIFFMRGTAFWFALFGIMIFTILTGAEASAVRSSLMGILALYARREGRINNPINAIIFAGVIMVAINPLILRYDVGFQLSFMATLGLICMAPLIEQYFERVPSLFELRETLIMTISAQLFVFPIIVYHFNTFSLTSLPVNILILPLIPYAMFFGFVAGLLGMVFVPLGQIFGVVAWGISEIVLQIIILFAKLSWSSVDLEINGIVALGMYLAIIVIIWKIRLKKVV